MPGFVSYCLINDLFLLSLKRGWDLNPFLTQELYLASGQTNCYKKVSALIGWNYLVIGASSSHLQEMFIWRTCPLCGSNLAKTIRLADPNTSILKKYFFTILVISFGYSYWGDLVLKLIELLFVCEDHHSFWLRQTSTKVGHCGL